MLAFTGNDNKTIMFSFQMLDKNTMYFQILDKNPIILNSL